MKEIGPIAGINHENTMTKISHAEGTDHQGITKMIMEESIIIHFRTMEIRENIKRIIKTSIGKKTINIREGLEIIMKISMRTGMIGRNMNTNTEMKTTIWAEIGLEKNSVNAMQEKTLTFQNFN